MVAGLQFRTSKNFAEISLVTLYKARVPLGIKYCSHVWGTTASSTFELLDSVQERLFILLIALISVESGLLSFHATDTYLSDFQIFSPSKFSSIMVRLVEPVFLEVNIALRASNLRNSAHDISKISNKDFLGMLILNLMERVF